MADSSIDDFFAKKDKSKKKGKSKLMPADLLNDTKEKPKKLKLKKPKEIEKTVEKPPQQTDGDAEGEAPPAAAVEEQFSKKVDEEWKEYVDDSIKDYTGLKIQSMKIGDEEAAEEDVESEGEVGEDGEPAKPRTRKAEAAGPWQQLRQPGDEDEEMMREPTPPPPPPAEPVKEESTGPKKYVPPGARAAAAAGGLTPMRKTTSWRTKNAPNLQSEEDFPTLGGPSLDQQNYESTMGYGAQFEKVRSGGQQHTKEQRSQKLELGNRFDSLRGGD